MGNNKYKVLIIDDEANIRSFMGAILESNGYQVLTAATCAQGEMMFSSHCPDLVLLDLMLPGLTGEEFIAQVRRNGTMPIIVLSAKAGLEDKVNVLRMGADDFIPKPFDNLEVLARVEAQLRRVKKFSAPPEKKQRFVWGDLCLDREEFTVTAEGNPVTLTAREFEILALLMEYPKKVFTREQIYQHVWGEDYFGDDNTVNVHISNLRSKLGKASDREYIKTVWGIGFKMAD